jgi:hypothetical protein
MTLLVLIGLLVLFGILANVAGTDSREVIPA